MKRAAATNTKMPLPAPRPMFTGDGVRELSEGAAFMVSQGLPAAFARPQETPEEAAKRRKRVAKWAGPDRVLKDPSKCKGDGARLGAPVGYLKSTGAKPSSPTEEVMTRKTPKKTARARTAKAKRTRYDWNAAREAAAKGTVPKAPDFSAPTHRSYRGKLAEVVALVKAGDPKALRAYKIIGFSSSRNAIRNYQEAAIIALEAKK